MVKLALNKDGNAVPATIEAPEGSTVFANEPTSLRVSKKGEKEPGMPYALDVFGVMVKPGNEFNLKLETQADLDKSFAATDMGLKFKVVERTDNLLLYTVTAEGRTSYQFSQTVELAGKKWVCQQGNSGGWSEAQAREQIAACLTLKAI